MINRFDFQALRDIDEGHLGVWTQKLPHRVVFDRTVPGGPKTWDGLVHAGLVVETTNGGRWILTPVGHAALAAYKRED